MSERVKGSWFSYKKELKLSAVKGRGFRGIGEGGISEELSDKKKTGKREALR